MNSNIIPSILRRKNVFLYNKDNNDKKHYCKITVKWFTVHRLELGDLLYIKKCTNFVLSDVMLTFGNMFVFFEP